MVVAGQSLLDRPDAVLTLGVIAVSVLVLVAMLAHALLRHRRLPSWSRAAPQEPPYDVVPPLPAQRPATAVATPPAAGEDASPDPEQSPETIDLTINEIDLTLTEIDRAIAEMEQRLGPPTRRPTVSETGWPV